MHASAIIRVFCVDAPLRGVHFLDEDSGQILFDVPDGKRYIYRVDGTTVLSEFGRCPAARFVRVG